MTKKFLKSNITILLVCFCVFSLFVLTFPKIGKTDGVHASATAYAYKSGQNWFWSTFKAEAYADVYAPEGAFGGYQLEVAVTGKTTKRIPQIAFFNGVGTGIENKNTYRAWGSGDNVNFSASSESDITSNVGDDDDDAFDQYPPP